MEEEAGAMEAVVMWGVGWLIGVVVEWMRRWRVASSYSFLICRRVIYSVVID
jgi:hypothetical protein